MLEGIAEDLVVVEFENVPVGEDLRYRHLPGIGSVRPADRFGKIGDDRPVGNRDDPHPWITIGVAVRPQLCEMVGGVQPGLFGEFPDGGLTQVLFGSDKPSRECQPSFVGLLAPLDEGDLQHSVLDCEHDDVDGHRKRWEGSRVVVGCGHPVSLRNNCAIDKNYLSVYCEIDMKASRSVKSKVLGSLLGGAVGDALGGPVEFMRIEEIHRRFGPAGVVGYPESEGAFTDDTQMTLWTAEGLVRARQRQHQLGLETWDPMPTINNSYLRWLLTQWSGGVSAGEDVDGRPLFSGWLIGETDLWVRMAPGNTCLSALIAGGGGTRHDPMNDSKGCGGVMRAAPAGLIPIDDGAAYQLGCDLAALTHGHPAGYVAAGALALILSRIREGDSLESSVDRAIVAIEGDEVRGRVCADLLRLANGLARSEPPSYRVVERIGAGWVAEEALAISVYCALVAEDFRKGVLLAVNHGGDSDSTGSIAGQVLGAMLGVDGIPAEWLDGLRLRSVVERVSGDLYDAFYEDRVFPAEEYPTW